MLKVNSSLFFAGMVELVDTLALGASTLKGVEVRVLFPAPRSKKH